MALNNSKGTCNFCQGTRIVGDGIGNSSESLCQDCGAIQSREDGILNSLEENPGSFEGLDFARNTHTRETRKYKEFIARTYAITNVLGLPVSVIDQVKAMADRLWVENTFKYRSNVPAKIAVAIFCITRHRSDINLTPKQLAKACQTRIFKIRSCYNACRKVVDMQPSPVFSFRDYIEKVAMRASMKDYKKLAECALDIESVTEIGSYGGNQIVICISLLLLATCVLNVKFSVHKMCRHFSVHTQTVFSRASETRSRLFKYAERIPWKPPGLNAKTVRKFIPEILRYHKEFGSDPAVEYVEKKVDIGLKISVAQEEIKREDEMEEKGMELSALPSSKDPHVMLIKELLRKGCNQDEMCKESFSSLSRKYLDLTANDFADGNDDVDDEEISDDEINEYLKTKEEIDEVMKCKISDPFQIFNN